MVLYVRRSGGVSRDKAELVGVKEIYSWVSSAYK